MSPTNRGRGGGQHRKPMFVSISNHEYPTKVARPDIRAMVDLQTIGVTQHTMIIAQVPAQRRSPIIKLLARHPAVLACRAFTTEPREILLEVIGLKGHKIQTFVEWARTRFDMQVRDFLPIERILKGGPEKLPAPEFTDPKKKSPHASPGIDLAGRPRGL